MFKKNGVTLIQGDLNARTGNSKDFIEYDKFDSDLGLENLNNQHMRNSQDTKGNTRGKELLDVCKSNDFLILNVRKIGDLSGSFTSHQWNGSAVVDYILTPNDFAKNISKFSVGKFVPDHCPMYTTIVFNGLVSSNINNRKGKLNMLHPGFVWDEIDECPSVQRGRGQDSKIRTNKEFNTC